MLIKRNLDGIHDTSATQSWKPNMFSQQHTNLVE